MGYYENGFIIDKHQYWRERDHRIDITPVEENVRMASGRLVTEVRYSKAKLSCDFDYLPDVELKKLLVSLRKDNIEVTYYRPDQTGLATGVFKCTSYPAPIVREWDRTTSPPSPMWADIKFVLEER